MVVLGVVVDGAGMLAVVVVVMVVVMGRCWEPFGGCSWLGVERNRLEYN